jgi:hypothetical protein
VPEGNLTESYVMATQKLALETDEPGVLRIANKFP